MHDFMKPLIAITLGDPAGIGPEIVAKALRDPSVSRVCEPLVIGEPPSRLPRSFLLGRPSRLGGRLAIDALRKAVQLVQQGRARALVTAPVSKEAFDAAGLGFPGHTEWLAKMAKVKSVGMLMAAGSLRALLMTRHVPLREVSRHLTAAVLSESAHLAFDFCRTRLKKSMPRLVVCGLNPHAGDNGLIGREEKTLFRPAIARLRKKGFSIAGPYSADAVYPAMAKGVYDVALAAYHDQGMIPLKLFAGRQLVNITLGLPYVRTSPGHGTAYDIAGKGKADPGPMVEAILLAARYSA